MTDRVEIANITVDKHRGRGPDVHGVSLSGKIRFRFSKASGETEMEIGFGDCRSLDDATKSCLGHLSARLHAMIAEVGQTQKETQAAP